MKNEICFIMPIYPPHFEWAHEFICSYFKFNFDKEADLIFVFTDENEQKAFKSVNFTGFYKSIVLSENLRVSRDEGIINIKKFYALKMLSKSYKYSIIVDSESELIKGVNLAQICDEFYQNKVLFANKTKSDHSVINTQSRQFFPAKKLKNDELYFWFNQPCIYKNAFLDEFFEKCGFKDEKDFLRLNFYTFDYLIYGYFLLYFKGFELENVEVLANWGFLECPEFEPLSEKFMQIKPKLCNPKLYDKLNNSEIFLFIQKNVGFSIKSKDEILNEIYLYKLGFAIMRNRAKVLWFITLPFILKALKLARKESTKAFEVLNLNIFNEKSLNLSQNLAFKIGKAYAKCGGGGGEPCAA